MSERMYAWLLRLYPSQFRERYEDQALQLFRDRARDEKGLVPSLRLWIDLLVDLAISLPREYFYIQPEIVGASALHRLNGVPVFYVLQDQSPHPAALLFGGLLSLVALVIFWIALSLPGNSTRIRLLASDPMRGAPARSQQQVPQTDSRDTSSTMKRAAVGSTNLRSVEQQRVIDGVITNLNKYYVDRDVAQKVASALLAHKKNGDDDAVTDGASFADLLTKQMREVSHDQHLVLVYSQTPLAKHASEPTPEDRARYREAMKRENCTFEKVQILPANIGYLKFNWFPDPSLCGEVARAAMASLNHADAIIFDLRDNRGGEPGMVALLADYLFDHPEYWYNPRENTTPQSWTRSPAPGSNLADKPAYVLTSARTLSGAEQFCYNLKMLRRATLVGERTGGSAHAGVWHGIDDHFGMGIPDTRPINPFSESDWEGAGVEPDVKVKAADALETAEKLARSKLGKSKGKEGARPTGLAASGSELP